MHFELRTPDQTLFDGKVDAVSLPGSDGRFQVLDRHADLLSSLSEGFLVCQSNQKQMRFSIGKGIAEVRDNRLRVLVANGASS